MAAERIDSLIGMMVILIASYGVASLIHWGRQQRRAMALAALRREVLWNEREILDHIATVTRDRLEGKHH